MRRELSENCSRISRGLINRPKAIVLTKQGINYSDGLLSNAKLAHIALKWRTFLANNKLDISAVNPIQRLKIKEINNVHKESTNDAVPHHPDNGIGPRPNQ
jgi:hypothetical protein